MQEVKGTDLSMADEGSDTSDESLDVRSEKFDPLKALYSSKVRLASSVPIYDNISKFESILKGINVSTKVRIAHCLLLSALISSINQSKIVEKDSSKVSNHTN